ncbi:putative DNA-binding protein Rv0500A [Sporomusaceae bacterium FL31]|nr:putative DNA-binding protein Rv0500A [Sporomusaceae bacterium FL31]GCE32804.1 putative DNA-binding protein Rv0500A [Sporomusaceae bacterium]
MPTINAKPQITLNPVNGINFKYFYVSEVAAMLRVSSQVIYQLIHEHKLKAIKVGKAWKVSEGAIADYIRSLENS